MMRLTAYPAALAAAMIAALVLLSACSSDSPSSGPDAAVDEADMAAAGAVLDIFHAAAASASWDRYFAQMTDTAIFLGTDSTERWDKPTFRRYAEASNGWLYVPRERNLTPLNTGVPAIFFDELLDNEKYGLSRGTGVLVREDGKWRIAQYHLTFPIPNDLAAEMTAAIKQWRAVNPKD